MVRKAARLFSVAAMVVLAGSAGAQPPPPSAPVPAPVAPLPPPPPKAVPGASLDWTGSPRVVLGYRLDNGAGAFTVSFRSLVSQGSSTLPNFDPAGFGFIQSRLNANIVDLDYSVTPIEVAPFWFL